MQADSQMDRLTEPLNDIKKVDSLCKVIPDMTVISGVRREHMPKYTTTRPVIVLSDL